MIRFQTLQTLSPKGLRNVMLNYPLDTARSILQRNIIWCYIFDAVLSSIRKPVKKFSLFHECVAGPNMPMYLLPGKRIANSNYFQSFYNNSTNKKI